ncbi:MAG: phosphate signaling complex protein PhoU [Acutalibacteraceae bacterium]|nr:phosphate signaling complex protein PhoU [Acutalibacteraceae bacterium]
MRDYFQLQIDSIDKSLIEMGLQLESAIDNAILTLTTQDERLLVEAKQIELGVNKMEKELEGLCLNVILRQQPVASDFHLVSAVLKMITDMERIGDIADDVAALSVMIKECRDTDILNDIIGMGRKSVEMLKSGIDSYVSRDVKMAIETCRSDDEVDEMFVSVKQRLIDMIKLEEKGADEAPDLLMIAKYFERLGDHCVNIAEWVVYAFTGNRVNSLDLPEEIDEALSDIQ